MDAGIFNIMVLHERWMVGGSEKLTVNLINQWRAWGYKTIVVSLNAQNTVISELKQPEQGFYTFPRAFRYDLRMARQIRRMIVDEEIDVIVTLDPFDFLVARLAAAGLNMHPWVILALHSMVPNRAANFLKAWLFTRFLSGKEHLISICEAQRKYWSRVLRLPDKKFTTICNGVNTSYFCPDDSLRAETRKRLGIAPNTFAIVQVASLNPVKRHEISLKALKILKEQDPTRNYALLIVGGNNSEREMILKKLAEELGIQNSLYFLGSQADVRPYYQAADLFTLSSSSEVSSIAALEALAMGLPCVLTDVGGARELIHEGFNGYLVPTENPQALAESWRCVAERETSFNHQAIREKVNARYTIEDCSQNYINYFANLFDSLPR